MPRFEITRPDGAILRGEHEGHGPDMLLVSGLGGTGGFWKPVVAALSSRFRLIQFDQRGIASSSRGIEPVTIATLAEDAAAILDEIAAGPAILVGHSTGGCIVGEMALQDPVAIRGLVLSGAWGKRSRFMTELFRSRLAVLHTAPREYAALAALTSYEPGWLDAHWPVFEAAIAGAPVTTAAQTVVAERIDALLAYDRGADLKGLTVPVAVIGAEDDLIVPSFLQRELATLVPPGPLVILDGGGHFFPVSRTDEYAAHLVRFAEGFGSDRGESR